MAIELKIPPLDLSSIGWKALPFAERALQIAAQECDVYHTREVPEYSNRGPRVDAMLRNARSTPGSPWCGAFVAWCCTYAGWNPYSEIPGGGVMYPAAVVSWVAWARRNRRLKNSNPKRGDLFFYDRPGISHMGMVTRVGVTQIETLEGNTNLDGSPDGFEVARRTRDRFAPTGYITLTDLPPPR